MIAGAENGKNRETGINEGRTAGKNGKNWKEQKEQSKLKKLKIYMFFPSYRISPYVSLFTLFFSPRVYRRKNPMDKTQHHEPRAYCLRCRTWQQMQWRPAEKRGKKVETWFACADCGCEQLTIRYLTPDEVKAQGEQWSRRSGNA